MKKYQLRSVTLILSITLISLTSCSPQRFPASSSRPSASTPIFEDSTSIPPDLDALLEDFTFPPQNPNDPDLETINTSLPPGLLKDIQQAIYNGTSDSLIQELNDETLMITASDFQFQPNTSDESSIAVSDLNKAMQTGAPGCLIYQCDIDGDGTDEIIMVEDLKYEYSHSNTAYLLEKSGDKYIQTAYDYLGYYRCFAIFQYNGKYYLAANYDDYETRITKAVGLFELSNDKVGFMWLINNEHTYLRRISDSYQSYLLYKNRDMSIADEAQAYIDEIGIDLIYTDRMHRTFYGDEKERYDLLQPARDGNSDIIFWDINAIDVDNDGKKEFFDRKILYRGNMSESEITWYDPEIQTVYPAPFNSWHPEPYFLTQMWFKVIGNKTIIFSLYHKNMEDSYILDARIYEDGSTVPLLVNVINLITKVELSDYWDYTDSNWQQINYEDPDLEKAFPEDIFDLADELEKELQGGFTAVDYTDKVIPSGLILLMEKALFEGKPLDPDLTSPSFEINIEEFNRKLGSGGNENYDSYIEHIYQYKLGQETYYITVADTGGSARYAEISFYKEEDGKPVLMDSMLSLDMDARVIEYENEMYLLDSSYNYYSKYTDTVSILKLVPEGAKDVVTICMEPKQFGWRKVYNNPLPCGNAIDEYVAGLQEDLMKKTTIDDEIQAYTGDESSLFDQDKKLRLKSVGGDYNYYEIDYNNDGKKEYLSKHYWFPSNYTRLYLISNLYRFTDKRTVEINQEFHKGEGMIVQLWFKEIAGKIYTFRLFLGNGYTYFLNVSLIEGTNITQLQTYVIAPEKDFSITSGECTPKYN